MKKWFFLLLLVPAISLGEDTEVIRDTMKNKVFRERVSAIVALEAYDVLKHMTGDETMSPAPDANTQAWAKAAVVSNYDSYMEALLILSETKPASVNAALTATDTTYRQKLDTVLNEVVAAKN